MQKLLIGQETDSRVLFGVELVGVLTDVAVVDAPAGPAAASAVVVETATTAPTARKSRHPTFTPEYRLAASFPLRRMCPPILGLLGDTASRPPLTLWRVARRH
ncbi:MAG: hypothetical protein M0035_02840, partial [Actinomycetota bacterium]|nr:hypothetical protein [Actinomycetota bacterium]